MTRKGNEKSYGDVVKRLYAGKILRGQAGEKVRLPDDHCPASAKLRDLDRPPDRARLPRRR